MTFEDNFLALPRDKQEIVAKEVLKEHYRQSLFHTAKTLLGYKDITDFTHGEIISALEQDTKRKLIVCPRGSFKSSVCVVSYSIWLLLRNPNLRILIDSEVYTNSKAFLTEIKAKLVSPMIINLFGDFRSNVNWTEGSITIKQRTKVLKEPSITVSGILANKTGAHYDVILHDDMNSDKSSATQEGRKKVVDHYRMNISIAEPDAIIGVIGTRYASDDLIGFILENELGINSDGSTL